MAFKVGDKIVAIKNRPLKYDVTTDKVVCKVVSLHCSGMMTVVLLDGEGRYYAVDPQYFRHARPVFKGNQ